LIEEFTEPGDLVFDPFAGYGTSLIVARRMGRRAVGIEFLPDRVSLIQRRSGSGVTVHVGDVRDKLDEVPFEIRLCLTSPPYMTASGHPENPLTGYSSRDGDYGTYLDELSCIFARISAHLENGGRIVVNVADQGPPTAVTPLVADIGSALSRHLVLERTIPVLWDRPPPGIVEDTCLVFGGAAEERP
jgi:DNA modification methylase